MGRRWVPLASLLVGFFSFLPPVRAQQVLVRPAARVAMPAPVDSNSPAFWRNGRLFWFGSHGYPWLSEGADQFGPWQTRDVELDGRNPWPTWIESVYPDNDGVLWAWYHTEPTDVVPESTMTAPKIGAMVSFDGGTTLRDLGLVLESGDPINPLAQNGYFAGGHGDFTVIVDRERAYFYFLFDNYGGPDASQGVCIARMAFADRANSDGKVWKYYNGAWLEAGRGGRVTPIFPVKKPWQTSSPDAFWGPSVHWNTYLNCYVMLLNRASGEPGWSQEGVYVSFSSDLSRPESWTEPRKILDKAEFPGWYFFYPQVMGLEPGGTDRRAGQIARLYVGGISKWEIEFFAPLAAPSFVELSSSSATNAVRAGEAVVLSVTATASPPFTIQWSKDGVPLPGATTTTLTIPAATLSDAGTYTVTVGNTYGARVSNAVTLTVTPPAPLPVVKPPPPEAFLSNLSVRSQLPANAASLTVGFVLQSEAAKRLVLRAIGPALAPYGVPDYESDPRLALFDASSAQTAQNDDWRPEDAEAFARVGAFPLPVGSADAALVVAVPPGSGTALLSGRTGGVAMMEIYDPEASASSKLINLSARAIVGSGSNVLIGGFTLGGAGTKRLLIRAVGPQLHVYGVPRPLADPVLEIYRNGAELVATNDNWESGLEATFAEAGAGALPPGSRDAAVAVTLDAGSAYTVVVRSADGTVGEALLELYELR